MKSISVCLLLWLIVMITGSCKNSIPAPQNSSTDISSAPDNISLAFDGVSMSSAMPQAIYSREAGILQITSTFSTNKGVTLNINNPAPGTFSIKNGVATGFFSLDVSPSDLFTATAGTISISSFTTNSVSGTFQFSGSTIDSVTGEITNGQFRVHLITQ